MTGNYVTWKGWTDARFGRFDPEDDLYYAAELGASGIQSVQGLEVAELGYGNGTFAGWVRRAGGHWTGKEVIPELQKRAAEAGFQVIAPDADFAVACGPGRIDLMVAFDVIEHLELDAIRLFLNEAREALKVGGRLVMRSPSGDSPFAGAMYHGDLTHRTLLGSSAIRQLAVEADFQVCQVRSPVLPIKGLGPLRTARRVAVRVTHAVAFSFVRHVLMANRTAVVSPNMVVVLRKKDMSP